MHIHNNLKFLRLRGRKTQEELARELSIERASWTRYEKNISPPYAVLIRISDHFGISIDHLLRTDLERLQESKLRELENSKYQFISGKHMRVLVSTVDSNRRDNIEMVSVKAKAGYISSYADPEFIEQLPVFQLPFLQTARKYRGFQIEGDSMLPVAPKSWIVASYVENWADIRDGDACVLITQEDCVFKIVYRKSAESKAIQLVSLNTEYKPYELPLEEIREIWKFEAQIAREINR